MDPVHIIEQTSSGPGHGTPEGSDVDKKSSLLAHERIKRFVSPHVNVVLEGEPGVGKKYHALLLHSQTKGSAKGSFVELMPETPEDVFRVILFDVDRKRLEGKHGKLLPALEGRSTLYLHDIGEFGLMNQILLSRFLIEQSQRTAYSNTRVIASTTIPWQALLRRLAYSFAQRLQQFELCPIPPLRERIDELPSLVKAILEEVQRREKADCWRVTEETLLQLAKRNWRDNIRELEYVVEAAAANSSEGTLRLPSQCVDEIEIAWEMFRTIQAGKRLAIDHSLALLEKAIVERALVRCNFDQRKTARLLAMTEPNLTYRIKKFNIHIPLPR